MPLGSQHTHTLLVLYSSSEVALVHLELKAKEASGMACR
jgi:hypothetical protein